ncbi:hypothetical protein K437DRAFT_273738 [Tilletiaria anomala UBC 951]|uniref:Uncharacterized protein n=1 Tax=Tilletiaria anomala (strain ATCC 24038 / CBS 436.72 / UBC 951) TaxID=1037660 RepID=A0A066W7U1_TILAU|nr:uncharacterized protein K437DRAFT_273738 [Tilletiaria anomala UBC 951]KDN47154.1 hypothetical protein K437DRAFT_273738 [Tilletiaria anomala UBC 951]
MRRHQRALLSQAHESLRRAASGSGGGSSSSSGGGGCSGSGRGSRSRSNSNSYSSSEVGCLSGSQYTALPCSSLATSSKVMLPPPPRDFSVQELLNPGSRNETEDVRSDGLFSRLTFLYPRACFSYPFMPAIDRTIIVARRHASTSSGNTSLLTSVRECSKVVLGRRNSSSLAPQSPEAGREEMQYDYQPQRSLSPSLAERAKEPVAYSHRKETWWEKQQQLPLASIPQADTCESSIGAPYLDGGEEWHASPYTGQATTQRVSGRSSSALDQIRMQVERRAWDAAVKQVIHLIQGHQAQMPRLRTDEVLRRQEKAKESDVELVSVADLVLASWLGKAKPKAKREHKEIMLHLWHVASEAGLHFSDTVAARYTHYLVKAGDSKAAAGVVKARLMALRQVQSGGANENNGKAPSLHVLFRQSQCLEREIDKVCTQGMSVYRDIMQMWADMLRQGLLSTPTFSHLRWLIPALVRFVRMAPLENADLASALKVFVELECGNDAPSLDLHTFTTLLSFTLSHIGNSELALQLIQQHIGPASRSGLVADNAVRNVLFQHAASKRSPDLMTIAMQRSLLGASPGEGQHPPPPPPPFQTALAFEQAFGDAIEANNVHGLAIMMRWVVHENLWPGDVPDLRKQRLRRLLGHLWPELLTQPDRTRLFPQRGEQDFACAADDYVLAAGMHLCVEGGQRGLALKIWERFKPRITKRAKSGVRPVPLEPATIFFKALGERAEKQRRLKSRGDPASAARWADQTLRTARITFGMLDRHWQAHSPAIRVDQAFCNAVLEVIAQALVTVDMCMTGREFQRIRGTIQRVFERMIETKLCVSPRHQHLYHLLLASKE